MYRKLSLFINTWELIGPFSTAKETVTHIDTLTACINQNGLCGKGEALGVYYLGETAETMRAQAEAVCAQIPELWG